MSDLWGDQIPPQKWPKLDLPHPLYDGPTFHNRRVNNRCYDDDVREGLNVWKATDAGDWWFYAGENTTDAPLDDGKSTGGVVFYLPRNTMATTTRNDGGIIGTTFTERDVSLHGNLMWTAHTCGQQDDPGNGIWDVTTVIAHEVGHLLGLDQVDMFTVWQCTSDTNTDPQEVHTMENNAPLIGSSFCPRTLHAHDQEGANQIYPLVGPDPANIADLIVESSIHPGFNEFGDYEERALGAQLVLKGAPVAFVTVVVPKGHFNFNLSRPGEKRLFLKKRDDGTYLPIVVEDKQEFPVFVYPLPPDMR